MVAFISGSGATTLQANKGQSSMGVIRFVLALSVVFWHIRGAPYRLLNAQVAVILFFIISGFYMAMVINEKYAKGQPEHWIRTFYFARFWRLYPPYFVMFLVMMLWGAPTNLPSPLLGRLPMSIFDQVVLAIPNVALFGQDLHQFLVRVRVESAGPPFLLDIVSRINPAVLQDDMMAVGHAWSLVAEATFYLIAPFIVCSARRTTVALVATLALRFFFMTILGQRSGIWGYFFFPGAACMFILGSAAYHAHKFMPRPDLHPIAGWVALTGFATWFGTLVSTNNVVMASPADWSIDLPKFWVLYLLFAASVPFIFEATKNVKIDREIGEISYPLYVVHGLVVGLVYFRWSGPQGSVPDAWAAVTLSIFAAYIMRQFVETPIERWRNRILGIASHPSTSSLAPSAATPNTRPTRVDSLAPLSHSFCESENGVVASLARSNPT
jgi:peptidoglycan/LPS O-acetylase OafA/YrhL